MMGESRKETIDRRVGEAIGEVDRGQNTGLNFSPILVQDKILIPKSVDL
jgi:hypothetical protein